jgi:hypothetical protein
MEGNRQQIKDLVQCLSTTYANTGVWMTVIVSMIVDSACRVLPAFRPHRSAGGSV